MTDVAPPHSDTSASPARIGTLLLIAADTMFFTALISAWLVLRSAQPDLFTKFAQSLNHRLALVRAALLILSAITMAIAVKFANIGNRNLISSLMVTVFLGSTVLAAQSLDFFRDYRHHSIVATDQSNHQTYAYDGTQLATDRSFVTIEGYRKAVLPNTPLDIHLADASDFVDGSVPSPRKFQIDRETISQDLWYGPSKNIFYACYDLFVAAVMVHLLVAILIVVGFLLATICGKVVTAQIQNAALYWYFCVVIWLVLFPLLFFV